MSEQANHKKSQVRKDAKKSGKLYFSKEMERKVFFFMTMAMLLAGVCVKLGIF